jgi:hypothetical protein
LRSVKQQGVIDAPGIMKDLIASARGELDVGIVVSLDEYKGCIDIWTIR